MRKQVATLIKSFVTKRLTETSIFEVQLNSLWRLVLGPIIQNYSESISSLRREKKNRLRASMLPSLALGLGAVEFIMPDGVVYESNTNALLEVTNAKRKCLSIAQHDTSDDSVHVLVSKLHAAVSMLASLLDLDF